MAYILGQYNQQSQVAPDGTFMTLIKNGTVKRKESASDEGGGTTDFYNECIQSGSTFIANNTYYFHGKIKRMLSNQTFYIKLINYDSIEENEQYIKTVMVGKGDPDEWVDVEFIFTPYSSFDTIIFEFQRAVEDYRIEMRVPIIIYEELSIVQNTLSTISNGKSLVKIGVQSRPGFLMCINREGIRTCKTGIYELKNGVIVVNFFSVINAADETTNILEEQIAEVNAAWEAAEAISDIGERIARKLAIGSRCIFNASKERLISGFALDYLYREE